MEHCTLMSQVRGRNYARDTAILVCAHGCVGENRVISQSGAAISYGPLIMPGRFGSDHSDRPPRRNLISGALSAVRNPHRITHLDDIIFANPETLALQTIFPIKRNYYFKIEY